MKGKILNFLIIVASLGGYLEWGGGNHAFLVQAEYEIISKMLVEPASVIHPLTLLPMTGQVLLLITLFQKEPGRIVTYSGITGLGLLMSFILLAGLLQLKVKVVLSAIPFMAVSVYTILYQRAKFGEG